MISTRDLSALPDTDNLRRVSQSLALLDAILCPKWDLRYYSFNAHWAPGEYMASMRNGSGNHYFCLFNSAGAILKGFDHESPMSPWRSHPPAIWPGVLDQVPSQFGTFLSQPAFALEETTFCIWRTYTDTRWQRGSIQFPAYQRFDGSDYSDGSDDLLKILDGDPRTYTRWAQDYYERPVNLEAVTAIYRHNPVTSDLIATLDPGLVIDGLGAVLIEIGYP